MKHSAARSPTHVRLAGCLDGADGCRRRALGRPSCSHPNCRLRFFSARSKLSHRMAPCRHRALDGASGRARQDVGLPASLG
jgi:hypothetical protein